jgi:uncharacterized membrane protein YbhN (UPF0104 family)
VTPSSSGKRDSTVLEDRSSDSTRATSAWLPWRNRALMVKAGIILFVTAAVIAGLVVWVGAADVLGLILSARPGHLLTATLLTMIVPIVHALRFRTVLRAIGYRVSQGRAYQLTMATWPIGAITPSKSGVLVEAYYLRHEVPAAVTLGAVLAERAVDVAVWGGLSLAGALIFDRAGITLFSALVLGGILAFFLVAPFARRLPLKAAWLDRIDMVLASTYALSRIPWLFAATVGFTLVNCVITILVTALLFEAVGADVPILFTVAGLPPAMFAGLIPFTLSGMGTRDSALILLFEPYATSAQALSVGILYAFFFRWLLALLGLPFLQRLTKES